MQTCRTLEDISKSQHSVVTHEPEPLKYNLAYNVTYFLRAKFIAKSRHSTEHRLTKQKGTRPQHKATNEKSDKHIRRDS